MYGKMRCGNVSGQGGNMMKKIAGFFTILFAILTIIGACYVLAQGGRVSAGYACVPMVLELVCMTIGRQKK